MCIGGGSNTLLFWHKRRGGREGRHWDPPIIIDQPTNTNQREGERKKAIFCSQPQGGKARWGVFGVRYHKC
jgi:hypothetical protein